ncbi:MAG: undecaprenyl/decaprenyl-phosphate alpha-N-acetylglucosaminyl 1-phosphate transferase [Clostridiales bacterium]|nr:undecaprenyl/decaprenyl-phosphate alpha-N-acetylglucosaminyl 1-phosphate transferase [Clostridiales bacterium]
MMYETHGILFGVIALVCSVLLAYAITPIVRVLAFKIKAVDIPKDNRRMHKRPIPLIGGLAIFLSFFITCLFFCDYSKSLFLLLGGGLLIVIVGIFDDIYSINPWLKFACQIAIAAITVCGGIRIDQINLGGTYISLGIWSIPLTVLWITGLTNAINIIDGLDGLSCGVSTISLISILLVIITQGGDFNSALITLILIGSCCGFLPSNKNPAKIFMGDTGALFLGYTLSVISIEGMFKLHTVISLIVPLIIFALPLADTLFAIIRRLLAGKSPFAADRGHFHHKLIDMGFTQKGAVKILYSICALLGLVAVFMCESMFAYNSIFKSLSIAVIAIIIFIMYVFILKNPESRVHTGLLDNANEPLPGAATSEKDISEDTDKQ